MNTRIANTRIAVLVALTAVGLIAADLPYAGKWKLNPSKSDFRGTTITYEQMPDGEMKATAEGQSYTFKADGKEYSTPWGSTAAWKSIDANTWETTNKANGKVISTDTLKLSADGKTLTVDSKVMKADGGTSIESAVLQRLSGGPGLVGKWKTTNVKASPEVIEFTTTGSDGLSLRFVDQGGICDAKFDGKEHPAAGTMWPAGWTCALTRTGERGFDLAWKKDGKEMFKSAYTASADGKTLTEIASPSGTTEKVKAVYDRQ